MKENNEKTLVEQAGWDEADTVSEGASWIHDDVHGGGHSHRVTRLPLFSTLISCFFSHGSWFTILTRSNRLSQGNERACANLLAFQGCQTDCRLPRAGAGQAALADHHRRCVSLGTAGRQWVGGHRERQQRGSQGGGDYVTAAGLKPSGGHRRTSCRHNAFANVSGCVMGIIRRPMAVDGSWNTPICARTVARS
jgi:hypothetical protein